MSENSIFPPDHPHGPRAAGKRIGKSYSWLANKRTEDSRRIAEGKEPTGPVWAKDPKGQCFYYECDLQDWLRRNVVRVVDSAA